AEEKSTVLVDNDLEKKGFHLITIHRAENTDDLQNMKNILEAFSQIETVKVWPMHPRTKNKLASYGLDLDSIPNLKIIEPVGYLDMLTLVANAKKIVTDSGGVQKEAYFMEVPCVTIREQTEWVETLEDDANILAGTSVEKILAGINKEVKPSYKALFGDGKASQKIIEIIENR
ncbi:MAG: UDP-N-acetylglucosamine 2-epimerase, partial [Bacillota bacterium]|nr:UDP-N-acetylglucosamine 2-epimerase [Bacillota bacterium]